MTPNQFAKLITSLQHRRKLSLTIDDLESEIIAFLITIGYEDKPVVINGWKLLFNGQELVISKAPVENLEQMELFERRSCT